VVGWVKNGKRLALHQSERNEVEESPEVGTMSNVRGEVKLPGER
jgi:hypothetical protein